MTSKPNAASSSREEVKQKLEQEEQAAQNTLTSVQQKIEDNKNELGELDYKLFEFYQEKLEQEATDVQLQNVDKQIDDAQSQTRDKDLATVGWSQHPATPDTPSFPKLPWSLGFGVGLGLLLSLGLAFGRELMDQSVRSPRNITRVGQMTFLGMIPHEDDDPQVANVPLPLVIASAPTSVIAEQFRQVRTRLQHASSLETTRLAAHHQPRPRRWQDHGRLQHRGGPGAQRPANPPGRRQLPPPRDSQDLQSRQRDGLQQRAGGHRELRDCRPSDQRHESRHPPDRPQAGQPDRTHGKPAPHRFHREGAWKNTTT